jgi:hypothetical protein
MTKSNIWTLTDARKQFPQLANLALSGEPQRITRYGVDAVVVADRSRFEVVPKSPLEKSPKRPTGRKRRKRR